MSTNDKYLVLRGKNKDIYFIQKRVSKKISKIIGKDFIKKSLETNNIIIARERRDEILKELKEIELNHLDKNVPIDAKSFNLQAKHNVPIKHNSGESNGYEIDESVNENDVEINNVLIKNADYHNVEEETDGYFSFIDYSRLPKKDDILAFIDKITPIGIIFLMIFVTLLV